jgi:hypothetical protein
MSAQAKGDLSMHHDPSAFDSTTTILGSGLTWLEVLASHARARPATDKGDNLDIASDPQADYTVSAAAASGQRASASVSRRPAPETPA